eukprot:657563-Karenia_brevis.AAC.1
MQPQNIIFRFVAQELAIAMLLGGAVDPEKAKGLARNYCEMCEKIGNPMIQWHQWLKINVYLFLRKLVYNQHEEDWQQISKSYNQECTWEVKAREGRAIKNYAYAHGLKEIDVDIQQ